MEFLSALEESGFATWVRESNSLLAYPGVLFFHTVGMAFVAGISGLIDLRLLGVADEMPLNQMRRLLPYMWAGFALNAGTGLILFMLDATTKIISPVFFTKLIFIGLALAVCVTQRKVFDDPRLSQGALDTKTKAL